MSNKGLSPNPARFHIPIELDRERVLCFDHIATFRIYQRYGSNFWRELFEADPSAPGAIRLRSYEALEFFLWAGLQCDAEAAGEELTVEHVRPCIVPESIAEIVSALLMALSATRAPAKKDPPKNGHAGEAAEPVVH